MKKVLILLSLPLMVSCAYAQSSVWKVSKDGNEMYLAGSVHVLKKSDYPLPTEFDQAFEDSDKLVFETDIAKLQDPALAQKMMAKGMLTDNKTLSDVLSEEVYEQLKDEAAKLSLSLAALGQFKPSLVIVTMTSLKLQQMGISSDGVDMYYFNKGKEAGKDLGYLESIDLQIR